MGEKFVSALEGAGAILAYWITVLAGLAWCVIAAAKAVFYREPLLYSYFPEVGAETYPVIALAGVLAVGLVYCTVKAAVVGRGQAAIVLSMFAPPVFVGTAAVTGGWLFAKPVASASHIPLAGLLLLSGWCAYLSHWGYLSPRRAQARQLRRESADGGQEGSARVSRPKVNFASLDASIRSS